MYSQLEEILQYLIQAIPPCNATARVNTKIRVHVKQNLFLFALVFHERKGFESFLCLQRFINFYRTFILISWIRSNVECKSVINLVFEFATVTYKNNELGIFVETSFIATLYCFKILNLQAVQCFRKILELKAIFLYFLFINEKHNIYLCFILLSY